MGSANGVRIEPQGEKVVTPMVTPARGMLTKPSPIYATEGANQLHLSMREATSKTNPIIIIVQQEGEVRINETVTRASLLQPQRKVKIRLNYGIIYLLRVDQLQMV